MVAPEEALAGRLIEKYGLVPRIDIEAIVAGYADIVRRPIPLAGIDGASLNLKVPGKRPTVVVNSLNPPKRLRFTYAHELGHILIPWHMGSFLDTLDAADDEEEGDYWKLELEANTFAASLLMPGDYLREAVEKTQNLARLHARVIEDCDVSAHAATIRLTKFLPANIVFAVVRDGVVAHGGRTDGTLAPQPNWNVALPASPYEYAKHHYVASLDQQTLHWWVLPDKVVIKRTDPRTWREVLEAIANDLGIPADDQKRYKASVNGVVAAANGAVRARVDYSIDVVTAACLQRFHGRDEYKEFVGHRDFEVFVAKKADALVNGDA